MLKNAFSFLGGAKTSTAVLEKEPSQTLSKTPAQNTTPVADPKPQAPVVVAARAPAVSSRIVDGQVQLSMYPEERAKTLTSKYLDAYSGNTIVEYCYDSPSIENADLTINAAYKQVFGNAHLMDSERAHQAESQLRSGEITVTEFIRQLAKSDRYRALFWDNYPTATAIELNFKHLLGRAPENQAEISEHVQILADGGFEAEIDSYLDSEEYFSNFGDFQVPYPRGYTSQASRNCVGFTHSFALFGAACASDKSNYGAMDSKLNANLMANSPSAIPPLRPIPDSFSVDLIKEPTPKIPKDIRNMAHQLWKEIEQRPSPYYY